jgi:hypothetical protein
VMSISLTSRCNPFELLQIEQLMTRLVIVLDNPRHHHECQGLAAVEGGSQPIVPVNNAVCG